LNKKVSSVENDFTTRLEKMTENRVDSGSKIRNTRQTNRDIQINKNTLQQDQLNAHAPPKANQFKVPDKPFMNINSHIVENHKEKKKSVRKRKTAADSLPLIDDDIVQIESEENSPKKVKNMVNTVELVAVRNFFKPTQSDQTPSMPVVSSTVEQVIKKQAKKAIKDNHAGKFSFSLPKPNLDDSLFTFKT
jgi:hypothetical protein